MGSDAGARTTPFCQIQSAVGEKPYVVVEPTTSTGYESFKVTASSRDIAMTIIGRGSSRIAVGKPNDVALAIDSQGGHTANVSVENFSFFGNTTSGSSVATRGITCAQTAGTSILTIRDCSIMNAGQDGLNSSDCTLTLDRSTISGNDSGGLITSGTTNIIVTNTFITGNGVNSDNPGVSLSPGTAGLFAFNTVVGNHVKALSTLPAGIYCQGDFTILDSIVWGNDAHGGSQLTTNCAVSNVVTGSGDSKGIAQDPVFADSTYRLDRSASANSCCIDAVHDVSNVTSNFNHDNFGTTRPQGAGYDIGAHEVQ